MVSLIALLLTSQIRYGGMIQVVYLCVSQATCDGASI